MPSGLTSPSLQPVGYRLRSAIQAGEFLITAEVAPPKGGTVQHMVQQALTLKARVHSINLTDGSRAVMRMSSVAAWHPRH